MVGMMEMQDKDQLSNTSCSVSYCQAHDLAEEGEKV